jgi:hypothetical protein
MPMKNPPHPGDLIRTEIIEALGLTVSRAAEILKVRRATLSDLLSGKSADTGNGFAHGEGFRSRCRSSPSHAARLRPGGSAAPFHTLTRRSGSAYGSGRSRIPSIMLKIAVFAPNAESDRDDGHHGQALASAQLAQPVTDLLQEVLDVIHAAQIAALLFDL